MTHAAATRERAIEAYQSGVPLHAIEGKCGIGHGVLLAWRRRLGVENRPLPLDSRHRKFNRDELRRLHAAGLSDPAIARRLGVTHRAVTHARHALGLEAHFSSRFQPGNRAGPNGRRGGTAVVALALLLGAGAAQAQGWQQHPAANEADPFMAMTHDGFGGAQIGCCHSQHCAYTEECAVPGGGFGVIGPDQLCHQVGDAAQHTHNCAPGQTSACFMDSIGGLQILCACLGAI